jgi:hypothetical protein
MTVFSGEEAVEEFLNEFDGWLSKSVHVYLLGGSAMTIHGLKDQTKDIDLALGVTDEFEHVYQSLQDVGFMVAEEPTASFEDVGRTVQLSHTGRGLQLDIFEKQVVGKVWLSDTIRNRADEFWVGKHAKAFVLADEDMFLLKAVSGGDVGSGRHRDIGDMVPYAQRGLDYSRIIKEIETQRPFNTGAMEATHIRDQSHPLFAIELSVERLSGLPREFTERVSEFATEFEVEYFVLDAVDDGLHEVRPIRERVVARVQSLSIENTDEVDAGIERLVQKHILAWDSEVVRMTV